VGIYLVVDNIMYIMSLLYYILLCLSLNGHCRAIRQRILLSHDYIIDLSGREMCNRLRYTKDRDYIIQLETTLVRNSLK